MKYRLILLFFTIPFFVHAQKSSYIKNRITFDISYVRVNYCMIQNHKEKKDGVFLSANYGLTKFMESGLYYYKYNTIFNSLNFVGIQNRFHILPYFVVSNSKFFRLDAYIFNQTGLFFVKLNNILESTYHTDFGIGTSLFLFKHIGVNFEYKWGFLLSKHVKNHNFQNGIKLGLNFKF